MSETLGNGAVVTFSASTNTMTVTGITVGEWARAKIDKSGLEDDGPRKFIPGHLYDAGEVEISGYFDSGAAFIIPLDGTSAFHEFPAAETVTITFPLATGDTTAATLVGTGFLTAGKLPDFADDEIQGTMVKVVWDGATGPKFTAAA